MPADAAGQPACASLHLDEPVFSAIIQSYQDYHRQPKQLVRRLHQAHPAMEVIVNDDARDASASWLEALTGPNDFLVSSPNVHEIRAYNRLALMARGKYLVILQGDYCLPLKPRWLNETAALFDAIPELGLVGGAHGYVVVREQGAGGPTGPAGGSLRVRKVGAGRASAHGPRHPLIRCAPVAGGCLPFMYAYDLSLGPLVFRREAFIAAGGFPLGFSPCAGKPGIGLDYELSLQLWRAGWRVGLAYMEHMNAVGGRKTERNKAARADRHDAEAANNRSLEGLYRAALPGVQTRIAALNAQLPPLRGATSPRLFGLQVRSTKPQLRRCYGEGNLYYKSYSHLVALPRSGTGGGEVAGVAEGEPGSAGAGAASEPDGDAAD